MAIKSRFMIGALIKPQCMTFRPTALYNIQIKLKEGNFRKKLRLENSEEMAYTVIGRYFILYVPFASFSI